MKKIILAIIISSIFVLAFAQDFKIVVNKKNPISALSKSDIKKIYTGKKKAWDNGSTIIPIVLKKSPVFGKFLKQAVHKNNSQFNSFWKRAVFTGTGNPPKEFSTDKEVINFISQNPQAIGFVSGNSNIGNLKEITLK